MGFSLSRALRAGVGGAAREAGEVFDSWIVEERRQREAAATQERDFAKMNYADQLLADREARRDELKEAGVERARGKAKELMGSYYAAAREEKLDPNSLDGLRFIASKALENGDVGVYDKVTDNIDKREKNLNDAELRKAQIAETHARRGQANAQREGERSKKGDENFEKRVIDPIEKTFVVKQLTTRNDKDELDSDNSAAPAVKEYAWQLRDRGVPENEIKSRVNKLLDIQRNEHKMNPRLSGLEALEAGQKRLGEERDTRQRQDAGDKSFAKGFVGTGSPETQVSVGVSPQKFGLLQVPQSQPQTPAGEQQWSNSSGNPLPYKPASELNLFTPNTSTRGHTSR